eukprot:758882-Hanusia_phi.AAC.8
MVGGVGDHGSGRLETLRGPAPGVGWRQIESIRNCLIVSDYLPQTQLGNGPGPGRECRTTLSLAATDRDSRQGEEGSSTYQVGLA